MRRNVGLSGQKDIGSWWGQFLLSVGQIAILVSLATMSFAAIAAYAVIQDFFWGIGIELRFWHFVLCIVVMLLIALVMAYKFSLPSFFSVWNNQFWSHKNPMRGQMETMNGRMESMQFTLENIRSRLDKLEKPGK